MQNQSENHWWRDHPPYYRIGGLANSGPGDAANIESGVVHWPQPTVALLIPPWIPVPHKISATTQIHHTYSQWTRGYWSIRRPNHQVPHPINDPPAPPAYRIRPWARSPPRPPDPHPTFDPDPILGQRWMLLPTLGPWSTAGRGTHHDSESCSCAGSAYRIPEAAPGTI